MENKNTEKIFVGGLFSSKVSENAPEWILGRNSIHVESLIKWLQENKKLADEKGFINTVTKLSKASGKRYIEVDTWKPTKDATSPVAKSFTPNVSDVPFEADTSVDSPF